MDKALLDEVVEVLKNCDELMTFSADEGEAIKYPDWGESVAGDCFKTMVKCRELINRLTIYREEHNEQ